ncbi:MAG: hypothetical protein AAGH60_01125 [Pseudomonadota bacterium]
MSLAAAVAIASPALARKGRPLPAAEPTTVGAEGVLLDAMDDNAPESITLGGVTVSVVSKPAGDGFTTPLFLLEDASGELFEFEGEETHFGFLPVTVRIAQLDPTTPELEVLTTSYTGGAHCCDRIQIASIDDSGRWSVQELGMFDGGYRLTDFNDDGIGEITVRDQSFLYTFDAYAGSWAPPQIFSLKTGALTDVSDEPAYVSAFIEEIGAFRPEEHRDRPGGLAGWAAMEARLGRGDAALQTIASFNVNPDFPYEVCLTGGSAFDCSPKQLRHMNFDDYLRRHLTEHGYLEAAQ